MFRESSGGQIAFSFVKGGEQFCSLELVSFPELKGRPRRVLFALVTARFDCAPDQRLLSWRRMQLHWSTLGLRQRAVKLS